VFMYNFFLGRTASGKVFDYQLSPEWVEYVFNLVFTQLIRRFPGTWFHVPIGSAVVEEEPSSALYMSVHVAYRQENNDYCLPYAVASCLYYMGHPTVALEVSKQATDWCELPGDMVLHAVRSFMIEHLPAEGQPMVFNQKRSRKRKMVPLSRAELVSERTPFLTLIRPVGNDGSIDHAVCVVDDLIFDARLPNTLKLCAESLDMICGPKGMLHLGIVFRFCLPHGTHKRKWEREMKENCMLY
jgi:hypothetical protein